MAVPTPYGMRGHARIDMARRMVSDLNFEEKTERVKKFGKYLKITFYITNGPRYSIRVKRLFSDICRNGISYLVRTNLSYYDTSELQRAGVKLIDVAFPERFDAPEETSLEEFHKLIKQLFLDNKKVSIGIQGYEEAPFVLAFALMVMGMPMTKALAMIREFDGEVSFAQHDFLVGQSQILKEEYEVLLTRRRPSGFISGMINRVFKK